MPTKVFSEESVQTQKRDLWIYASGQLVQEGHELYPTTFTSTFKEKASVSTPNYRALRRAKASLPENPFSYTERTVPRGICSARGALEFAEAEVTQVYYMHYPQANLLARPTHGSLISEWDVASRLLSKARRSEFSLPVTAIEARKTVSLVADTARTLAGVIFDLRRGDLVGAYRRLEMDTSASQRRKYNAAFGANPSAAAASYWLQAQYGWKPLLNDVKNGAEALAMIVTRNGSQSEMTVRTSFSARRVASYSSIMKMVSPSWTGGCVVDTRHSRRGSWTFKPLQQDLPGLLGLTNPLLVGWELIPFSFVADWFLPIGNYLESLDVPMRMKHVRGTLGSRIEERGSHWITTATSWNGVALNPDRTYFDDYTLSVSRKALTSAPSLNLADMTFNPRIGVTRAISSIALLRMQASRLNLSNVKYFDGR